MGRRGLARGAIVNLASTRAFQSEADTEAYSAGKGGVVALTHAMAMSLGPQIRVNSISPGWIHVTAAPLRPQDHRQHPVGRVGTPEDIAGLVAYLLSSPLVISTMRIRSVAVVITCAAALQGKMARNNKIRVRCRAR
ncbi:MAG: SDR family oxidoreductase [Desulfuromonadales bacterium]|nr:SDR family oxidoreductase [Desulfuromonadales bacterium]